MKAKDMREKSLEDLRELEKSIAGDHFQAKLKNFTNRLDDTSSIRKLRKDAARVKTILAQAAAKAKAAAAPAAKAAPAKAAPKAKKVAAPAPSPSKPAAKAEAAPPSKPAAKAKKTTKAAASKT
jgi:large subunit ribosomal protein L29